jgi:hypothetical protein
MFYNAVWQHGFNIVVDNLISGEELFLLTCNDASNSKQFIYDVDIANFTKGAYES